MINKYTPGFAMGELSTVGGFLGALFSVLSLAGALGLSDEQLDALFVQAAGIEA
ncbi:hypothetical protein ABZN20_10495 [Methylococcus sp. ANG]|uniref:hypothetical protein n=1 Tax=Methylococcus sp. ANG TaxID=3231903 RepID=UPI00345AA983